MKLGPLLLVVAAVAVASSGCAGAGVAAVGPLVMALQLVGDRTVERTLPADRHTSWVAAVDALERMAVQVREADRSGEVWTLKGTGGGVAIRLALSPVTARMTKLSLRVEVGKVLADKQTAGEILNQVGISLASLAGSQRSAPPSSGGAKPAGLAVLEEEIRHLRSEIRESRVRPPLTLELAVREREPSERSSVLTVPEAYGVPAIPLPADAPASRAVSRVPPEAVTIPVEEVASATRPPGDELTFAPVGEPLAVPLSPVGVLAPIPALAGTRSDHQ